MPNFKCSIFVLLFFGTVIAAASCESYSSKAIPKHTHAAPHSQQQFQGSLPEPIGYLSDFEFLFAQKEKQTLDSLLHDFENRTSIQIAVVTIDTTMTTKDSLDAFTLKIANAWAIGQKDKNNGVLVGISQGYKRIRIQNGYGIQKIPTNEETKEIVETAFIPGFRNSNYFQGTLTGLQSLMKILEDRYK
ncbi:MAG: TPM domain-containing protein [Bacteroidetes bacterium]|nr:MAG: TPM domain-containing protein [Bacteroidota bacterium]